MKGLFNLEEKRIKEIKVWAWAAAILPLSSLSAIFFIWYFGTSNWFDWFMTASATFFVSVGVIWWWWNLHFLRDMIKKWNRTETNVKSVLSDLVEIRKLLIDLIKNQKQDK
jgi:high-affinity Fe2+/Pb2+ permease